MKRIIVPTAPKALGYAGLIPFIILAAGLWVIPQQYTEQLNQALLTYAAIILSFMGAIHWGTAIELKSDKQKLQLTISVIPPLIAWLSLLLPVSFAYALLIVSFSVLCIIDSKMTKQGSLPNWYPILRIPLTTVVVLTLITSLIAKTSQ